MRLLQNETDLNELIMRERNAEIREVETAVVEVGQIFQGKYFWCLCACDDAALMCVYLFAFACYLQTWLQW